jgi:hypothetical protein
MATKKQAKRQVVVFARAPNSNWARILYGTLVEANVGQGTAALTGVRQCLYYTKETGGEAGLSAIGPQPGSRLSPKSEGRMEIAGVGLISDCSTVAVGVWESFK